MAEHSLVRARIDEVTKSEAAAVLATMGLSLSDAFRLLLKRAAAEKVLPFKPLVPNAETIAATREARAGGLPRFKTPADLLKDLSARDCSNPPASGATTSGSPRTDTGSLDASLIYILQVLISVEALMQPDRNHPLSGDWADNRDYHLEPDPVLIQEK